MDYNLYCYELRNGKISMYLNAFGESKTQRYRKGFFPEYCISLFYSLIFNFFLDKKVKKGMLTSLIDH